MEKPLHNRQTIEFHSLGVPIILKDRQINAPKREWMTSQGVPRVLVQAERDQAETWSRLNPGGSLLVAPFRSFHLLHSLF